MNIFDDTFYEHNLEPLVLCGACLKVGIEKTLTLEYTGDEAMYATDFTKIEDQDTEPYQCDDCLKQNEAYEETE